MFRPLILTLAAAAALVTSPAWADRAAPAPKDAPAGKVTAPIVIQQGRKPYIMIPAKYVKSLRAQAAADAAPQFAGISTRTLLFGSAAALCVACGLTLARHRAARLASALVVTVAVCGLGGSAIADLRVDPPKKAEPNANEVIIEVAAGGDSVVLTTP
jgi:hypothetical protein